MSSQTSRVVIVTDSTTTLPPDSQTQDDIRVIPLHVNFAYPDGHTETYLDQIELSTEDFVRKLQEASSLGFLPKTAQPSMGEFLRFYQDILAHAEEIVSIHIAAPLSGTVSVAQRAADQLAGRVRVIDSHSVLMSAGFLVEEAAEMARAGASSREIEEAIESFVKENKVGLLGTMDNQGLNYLHKGGRIGNAARLAGIALRINPVLAVMGEGTVEAVSSPRSYKGAERVILERLEREGELKRIGITYVQRDERVERLAKRLEEIYGMPVPTAQGGSVIATYTGPSLVVVCYLKK